jgi:hypothetical protein
MRLELQELIDKQEAEAPKSLRKAESNVTVNREERIRLSAGHKLD